MLIQTNAPRPADEMVAQLGPVLASHLVNEGVKQELPQLAVAQEFQERVVAPQNQKGMRGEDGIGQCVARLDLGIFQRLIKKHANEIKADSRKFWLVTFPSKYPHLGGKPIYHKQARVMAPGKLLTA